MREVINVEKRNVEEKKRTGKCKVNECELTIKLQPKIPHF